MSVPRLTKDYQLYIHNFRSYARVAGVDVQPSNGHYVEVSTVEGKIEVVAILYLRGVPYRPGAKPSSRLSMLVRAKEIYSSDIVLEKSNVETLYFEKLRQGEPAVPKIALHYDYKYQMGTAHPIFHVQLGAQEIPVAQLQSVRFEYALDYGTCNSKFINSIRIPTVHMGLPAALLSIVADHLDRATFAGYLGSVRTDPLFTRVLARIDCRSTLPTRNDSSSFRAHHLYC